MLDMRHGMIGRRMKRWGKPRADDSDSQDGERH
jgi:hypothetical protein